MQTINGLSLPCALAGKDSLTALAVEAAKNALQMAEVDPDDLDLVLLCTSTPDDLFGSAPQVQLYWRIHKLMCCVNVVSYVVKCSYILFCVNISG